MAFWGEFREGWRAVVQGEKEVSKKGNSSLFQNSHLTFLYFLTPYPLTDSAKFFFNCISSESMLHCTSLIGRLAFQ